MATKPDADRILRHLEALKQTAWLGEARAWWPNYLFHFTDLENAAAILEEGKLLARSRRAMLTDSASAAGMQSSIASSAARP